MKRFLSTTALQVVLVVNADDLSGSPALTNALFDLHSAAFVTNMSALGLVLASMSFMASRSGITPEWTGWIGLAGGVALLVAAIPSVANVNGGEATFVGFAGFIVWLLFVVLASVRVLMGRGEDGA